MNVAENMLMHSLVHEITHTPVSNKTLELFGNYTQNIFMSPGDEIEVLMLYITIIMLY